MLAGWLCFFILSTMVRCHMATKILSFRLNVWEKSLRARLLESLQNAINGTSTHKFSFFVACKAAAAIIKQLQNGWSICWLLLNIKQFSRAVINVPNVTEGEERREWSGPARERRKKNKQKRFMAAL
jgi:hypothetical protein